jgi:deoxyribodipyrimidine photo-lyase
MQQIELVWFKRDLRVHDHAPLSTAAARAATRGSAVLPLYVFEHGYWALPEASARQYEFLCASVQDLNVALSQRGQPLLVQRGDVIAVLDMLAQHFKIRGLYSHEETGGHWTFQRDLKVKAWCKARAIAWHESRQFGVVRGLQRRHAWAGQWEALMRAPVAAAPHFAATVRVPALLGGHAAPAALHYWPHGDPLTGQRSARSDAFNTGGRAQARVSLASFFATRGARYQRQMSSPLSAEAACSRLSAHLSLGNLSLREVAQLSLKQRARRQGAEGAQPDNPSLWPRSITSFTARLHWHCHFVQKLESEPEIEFCNMNRGFDGMREDAVDLSLVRAWARGETGWPMVDACMRMLNSTGWLNFRMRAMLVAVSSYHLWQHWRAPGLHLARQFIDYEPGIHWSQVQMQSGVTGINIPRIYNPVKQSQEQDPDGVFIRRWLPELAALPTAYIHQPWLTPSAVQQSCGVRIETHYPAPIREHTDAARAAKAKLTDWRRAPHMSALSDAVQQKHGSKRKSPKKASKPTKKAVDRQLSLF